MGEQSLFIEALERDDPAERAAFLDKVCVANPALRRRLERLLQRHQEVDTLLEPAETPTLAGIEPPSETESPGTAIGPYKLMDEIGEGGMGVVYLAEQAQPVRRKVALKIIKPGMDTKQVIARFEAERQALAMMDHPNIAKVHDAGATDSGRPYFVMELVRGMPITRVLRPRTAFNSRAARAVRPGLPGRAARASEGHHPPRPQTVEHPRDCHRRRGCTQGHRLRSGQGDRHRAYRADDLHRLPAARRHAACT